jgi:phosphoribosylamine--glycine ligase
VKVLVVGNGGREHALAWKLLQSPNVEQVFCTPGNGGTETMPNCVNVPVKVDDFATIAKTVKENDISLVVVGPELPLSLGITDYLTQQGIKVFGPNQEGAKIESSKSWAKELMISAKIPTARSETFTNADLAKDYIQQQGAPIVIKADGLAAGKGVIVATTLDEALNAVESLFAQNFTKLVIEEFLQGQEVSVLAITDGITIRPLIPAQDHKQVGEGDTGENTGGMGAYAPTPIANPELMTRIEKEILQPTLDELKHRGIDYRGVIYAGLMITPEGEPKILEFNCRFGDPETQAILPLLDTPLDELLLACAEQRLASLPPLKWLPGTAICVVTASGGYPGSYENGKVITGIAEAEEMGAIVFHAGTKLENGQVLTNGGRVLGITAIADTFKEAIAKVYPAVAKVDFDKIYYRRDIGHRISKLGSRE